MSAKWARKPLSDISTNAVPNPKRRKVAPKKANVVAANADNAVTVDGPQAARSGKNWKPPAVIAMPESFVRLHSADPQHGLGPSTRIPSGSVTNSELTPYTIFSLFWDDAILQHIAEATNKYAAAKHAELRTSKIASLQVQLRLRPWRAVDVCELRRFISATIFMGYAKSTVSLFIRSRRGTILPKCTISHDRYDQIKRYLHISDPDLNPDRKHWCRRLEPLSSHLLTCFQTFYSPGSHLAVDEMMSLCKARTVHTVRIPSKPISDGYKILAVCDAGYTLDWLYTSRVEGVAGLKKHEELTPTGSAVLQLCESVCGGFGTTVFMDNAFSTVPLFRILRRKGIGACGTAQQNAAGWPEELRSERPEEEWGDTQAIAICPPAIDKNGNTIVSDGADVLCMRWIDNNIVQFMTTVHPANESSFSLRRKPRSTSTNALIACRIFDVDEHRKVLAIPTVVNDYNHGTNAVDLADQRRAAYSVHQCTRHNWFSLFYFLLDILLVNTHILFELARQERFVAGLDSQTIKATESLSHRPSKPYAPLKFRHELVQQLTLSPRLRSTTLKKPRIRRTYTKKTGQVYFSKYTRYMPHALATGAPAPSPILQESDPEHTLVEPEQHRHLEHMEKRRSCIICRLDFCAGVKNGMSSLWRTAYQCHACTPPVALCAPQLEDRDALETLSPHSTCFTRWHER